MIAVEYHVRGSIRTAERALALADPITLQREVIDPWARWVLHKRIPKMYWNKGRIAGADGQMSWYALSKWTIASKGVLSYWGGVANRGKSTTPLSTEQLRMARSYRIAQHRLGGANWLFKLDNTARSRSKWSRGFDYPSALHTGWGPYIVRPRPGNKRGLAWPMQQGTVISASTGRSDTGGSMARRGLARGGKRTKSGNVGKLLVDAAIAHAWETHPKGAPPRPHIRWFKVDVIELGSRQLNWIMRGPAAAA